MAFSSIAIEICMQALPKTCHAAPPPVRIVTKVLRRYLTPLAIPLLAHTHQEDEMHYSFSNASGTNLVCKGEELDSVKLQQHSLSDGEGSDVLAHFRISPELTPSRSRLTKPMNSSAYTIKSSSEPGGLNTLLSHWLESVTITNSVAAHATLLNLHTESFPCSCSTPKLLSHNMASYKLFPQ
jgi:hypothetical protein